MSTDSTELTFVRCPSCRSLVPAVSTRCRMCGATLDASAAKGEEAERDQAKTTRVRQRTMSPPDNELMNALNKIRDELSPGDEDESSTPFASAEAVEDVPPAPPAPPQTPPSFGEPSIGEDPLSAYIEEVEVAPEEPAPAARPVDVGSLKNGGGHAPAIEPPSPLDVKPTSAETPPPPPPPAPPAEPRTTLEMKAPRPPEAPPRSPAPEVPEDSAERPRVIVETGGRRPGKPGGLSFGKPKDEKGADERVAVAPEAPPPPPPRQEEKREVKPPQPPPVAPDLRNKPELPKFESSPSFAPKQEAKPQHDRPKSEETSKPVGDDRGKGGQDRSPQERNDRQERREGRPGGEQQHAGHRDNREGGGQGDRNAKPQEDRRPKGENRPHDDGPKETRGAEQQNNRPQNDRGGRDQRDARGDENKQPRQDDRRPDERKAHDDRRRDDRRPQDDKRPEQPARKPESEHASRARNFEPVRSDATLGGRLFGWLVSYANPDGDAIELREGKFFVTRSSLKETDLILDDESVSTPHSMVAIGSDLGIQIQDLMSERGVFVRRRNGDTYHREYDRVELQHGDWVRFGDVEFLVSLIAHVGEK